MTTRDYHAAVISDTHLRAGRPDDDFYFDVQFANLLKDLATDGVQEVVLNGDIFEFACFWPDEPSHFDPGLGLTEEESLRRFRGILEAHPLFIEALRRYLNDGGRCIFVAGNHDWDLHWPKVRMALHDALGPPPSGSLAFVLNGNVYRPLPSVHIEHGHQLVADHHTFRYPKEPLRPTRGAPRLEQTVGGFILRHFINPIEQAYPVVNNVRPLGKVKWLEPNIHFLDLFRLLKAFLRQSLYERPSVATPFWMSKCLAQGQPSLEGLFTPSLRGPGGQLVAPSPWRIFADDQTAMLQQAAARLLCFYRGTRHVILGHSHELVRKDHPLNLYLEEGRQYLNPGSWMPCRHIPKDAEAVSLADLSKGGDYPYRLAFVRVCSSLGGVESMCEVYEEGTIPFPAF